METLTEIFSKIGNMTKEDRGCNDKGGLIHTYTQVYDSLFASKRENISFMEIGLALGDSIDLFDKYFNNSKIIGVDISLVFQPKNYRNEVTLIEADATKPDFLDKIDGKTFDFVIDDGSHVTDHQLATFCLLKSRMNKNSIYILEDLLSLDIERDRYLALHDNVEIIDMRSNGRFDNALCVIRF